jgi:trigger factor
LPIVDSKHEHPAAEPHPHHALPMNEQCRREVTVEVPVDVAQAEVEKLVRKYQRLARIPGFRAGKTPASIIRARFMEDIRSEVVDALLPEYLRRAVEQSDLAPVSQPHVMDLRWEAGQPLRFTAVFEVIPPFDVHGYKDLTVEKSDVTVKEEEVAAALQELRQRQASFEPVADRELSAGDFALVSFTGTAQGGGPAPDAAAGAQPPADSAAKPIEMSDVLVEIGGENTVPEFTQHLTGARPGDSRSFDVTYPADFSDSRLAGQVIRYDVKILGVKKKVLPDLTDGFARELGEFATIEDLRQRIRQNMEAQRKHDLEHTAKESLIRDLVARNEIPVPQALVDRQIDARLERGLRALAGQGMPTDAMRKLDFARLREGQRDAALREVRSSLLLEKIADLERIEATEEDLEKELRAAAEQSRQSVDALRARLDKDGALDRIRDRIRNEKALDFLYQRSA